MEVNGKQFKHLLGNKNLPEKQNWRVQTFLCRAPLEKHIAEYVYISLEHTKYYKYTVE